MMQSGSEEWGYLFTYTLELSSGGQVTKHLGTARGGSPQEAFKKLEKQMLEAGQRERLDEWHSEATKREAFVFAGVHEIDSEGLER